MRYDLHLKGYVGGWDFDADSVDWLCDRCDGQPLNVLIDSTGGSAQAGFAIQHAFSRHGDVTVRLIGYCASAATIAAMGAKRIEMESSAFFLVHKGSVSAEALSVPVKADEIDSLIDELKKTKQHLEDLDLVVAKIYARRCRKTPQELIALMAEERWLTAAEALEWGFVDEVVDSTEVYSLAPVEVLAVAQGKLPALPQLASRGESHDESRDDMPEPSLIRSLLDKIRDAFSREDAGRREPLQAAQAEPVQSVLPPQVQEDVAQPDDTPTVPVVSASEPQGAQRVQGSWFDTHSKALELYKSLP
ncbi:MAG: Clp protease ClpP [Muribaculaceae bacterium]|nr:Clp protease ClpP [Muribaculaceae bacterium]